MRPLGLLPLFLWLLFVGDAKADSFTIFMDHLQDATIQDLDGDLSPDRIDRTDANIRTENIAPGFEPWTTRLVHEFSLITLSGYNIQSAVFSFTGLGVGDIEVFTYAGDGTTALSDFAPPDRALVATTSFPSTTVQSITTVDVTAALLAQLSASGTFLGLQIAAVPGQWSNILTTDALGNPDLFNGGPVDSTMIPQLQIEATAAIPEPATLLLLASGIAALGLSRWNERGLKCLSRGNSMTVALVGLIVLSPMRAEALTTELISAIGDGGGNTLDLTWGITVDGSGNVYVTGEVSDNAFKITPAGVITEIIDAAGDGAGNTLNSPRGIAVDGSGNVYVAGLFSNTAFKITPGGAISKIIDFSGDGAGNTFDDPGSIAVDGSGNVYISAQATNNAFKITPGGVITEIIDAAGDGAGNTLNSPHGIAVDGLGNVYVLGVNPNNAFKITPGGVIAEIIDATGDGAGNTLDGPGSLAVDGSGNVYVTGSYTHNAFKITPAGVITEIIDAAGDGAGNTLGEAHGIAVDGSGIVYVTGFASNNAFKITPAGVITEIIDAAGDGAGNTLDGPIAISVDASGNVYVTGAKSDNAFMLSASDVPALSLRGTLLALLLILGGGLAGLAGFSRIGKRY